MRPRVVPSILLLLPSILLLLPSILLLLMVCGASTAQSAGANAVSPDEPQTIWRRSKEIQEQVQGEYIARLKQELAGHPDNLAVKMNLGRSYFWMAVDHNWPAASDAEKVFAEILSQDSKNETAMAYHGAILGIEVGNQMVPPNEFPSVGTRSMEELDRAVNLAPDSIEVRSLRAYAGLYTPSYLGRDPLAVQDFRYMIDRLEAAGTKKEDLGDLYLSLGDLYYKMGLKVEAGSTWRRAAELWPGTGISSTAESRLTSLKVQSGPELGSAANMAAFLGFLIGVAIFGILGFRLLRELVKNKRKRSRRIASLIVAVTGLLWNTVHLTAITATAVGFTNRHFLVWLAALTRKDPYLVLALAPIPLGLLLAYRFHKATFMDLVLKKGGALLLILVLSVINARIWGGLYVVGSYHLNSTLRPIVFTGVWLTVFALYFPLRRLFYRAVDRYLLKRRDYSQLIGSLNERLRRATDEESIEQLICDAIKEIFAADSAVFLGPQDDLAQLAAADLDSQGRDALLTRQVLSDDLYRRLEEHRVEVVLRLRSAEGLMGVMLVGSRAYGQGYLSEELHALAAIAGQVAPVIENTRLHEVRRRQAIAEQELRKMATQAELKALRAQIDPHFFFNALNSVAALIGDDPESAERLIEDISELFRHAFRPNREFVTLEQELELVDTYLQVESARFGERFKFEKLVDADTLELRIPALSIQPLVENAVKHGISKSSGEGRLVVSATVLEDRLVVCVSDSGNGISPSELDAMMSKGVGLRNVDGRLAALYGETARLRVESECGGGTTVSFSIPLEHGKVEPQPAVAQL